MEDFSLMDLLQKCLDFRDSPQNEELYKEIESMVMAINFRERLTLAEKAVVAMTTLNSVESLDLNPVECAFQIETALFFNGLCLYMTNITNDLPLSLQTMEVYDVLVTFGVEDRALEFCGADYQRLRRMVEESFNFSNIFRLVKAAKDISPEGIEKLREVLTGFQKELTPERIRELRTLIVDADPTWKALKETIGEEAVSNAMLANSQHLKESLDAEEAERSQQQGDEGDGK